jgi:hypothetical protein
VSPTEHERRAVKWRFSQGASFEEISFKAESFRFAAAEIRPVSLEVHPGIEVRDGRRSITS